MKKIVLVALMTLCSASFSFGENIAEKKCKKECSSYHLYYTCSERLTYEKCYEECVSKCMNRHDEISAEEPQEANLESNQVK